MLNMEAIHVALQNAIRAGTLRPDCLSLSQQRLSDAAVRAVADMAAASGHVHELNALVAMLSDGDLRIAPSGERILTGKTIVSRADIDQAVSRSRQSAARLYEDACGEEY